MCGRAFNLSYLLIAGKHIGKILYGILILRLKIDKQLCNAVDHTALGIVIG